MFQKSIQCYREFDVTSLSGKVIFSEFFPFLDNKGFTA